MSDLMAAEISRADAVHFCLYVSGMLSPGLGLASNSRRSISRTRLAAAQPHLDAATRYVCVTVKGH